MFAKLLLQDYAGDISEESAIHLYIFQSLILHKQYPEIASDLFHIAIIEMHHLQLLGETINLLGLTPEFVTYQSDFEIKHYWSSKNVDYCTSIIDILTLNIQKEYQAIKMYLAHYQLITDPHIKELLLRIIEDEKIHLSYFENQLIILKKENMA